MKKILSVCVLLFMVAGMYFYTKTAEYRGDWREDAMSTASSNGELPEESMGGRSSKADTARTKNTNMETENFDWYTCVSAVDGYELTLYDRSGQKVHSEVFPREPGIRWVNQELLEISISVGSPATYVFWFNTTEARMSDTYFNPILVGERYVAYMEDNEELLLRDLFGEGLLEMRIRRNFTKTADPMSAIWQMEMIDKENIVLTYIEGEDYTEVSETINVSEAIKLEKPYVPTAEENRVLLAYAKYFQKYLEESPYDTENLKEWIKYDLVFIDVDNIPELAVIFSDSHADGVHIFTYHEGTVTEAGVFGSWGTFQFAPYENLIYSGFANMGETISSFYRLQGAESVELQTFHSYPEYRGASEYVGERYEVDGVKVSEEEYRQAGEEWEREELKVWGYDDAVSVKDIDDLYREMYRRFSAVKEQERMEQYSGRVDSCPEEWKLAYLSYLDSMGDRAESCTYSLIYVDDDDIPELVVNTGFEAGGCEYLTFHDHALDVWQSARLNVTYIERGNMICNSDGHMDYYYDEIYTIQDGKWVYVDGGKYGIGPDGYQLDENENPIYVYHWGGEDVSIEEYQARLNAVYPEKQGIHPQKYYILDEITSLLRTGDVASVGHRYELIVEDVTWKEAQRLCRERGGYLATITSQEEFQRLQERILSEGKENVTFFVGAANGRAEGFPFGYRWLEPRLEEGYNMLDLYNALFQDWLKGEPSYTGITEDGREVREEYVVLFYRRSDGRCYLNDVPNDILDAAPSYAGRVGYICEYE